MASSGSTTGASSRPGMCISLPFSRLYHTLRTRYCSISALADTLICVHARNGKMHHFNVLVDSLLTPTGRQLSYPLLGVPL